MDGPGFVAGAVDTLSDDDATTPASSSSRLPPVETLSDEDNPRSLTERKGGVKRKLSFAKPARTEHETRTQIARITQSVCRCARKATQKRTSCFASFASLVAEVATLRMKICRMHKLDADKFVPCPVPLVAFLLNVSFFLPDFFLCFGLCCSTCA